MVLKMLLYIIIIFQITIKLTCNLINLRKLLTKAIQQIRSMLLQCDF